MALVTKIPQKKISSCFKMLKDMLKKNLCEPSSYLSPTVKKTQEHPVISFSRNYGEHLNLPEKWLRILVKVANKACPDVANDTNEWHVDKKWDGRSRASIAATVVYI